jgi:AcrR family transcriptional regulator
MNVKNRSGNRKAEQSEATQASLLAVARRLFSERGYASVSTEEIVQAAGVTRGALYHHFRGKQDLFTAVVESLEQEILERVAAAAVAESDPWEQQRLAVGAFLDACLDPAVQRIILTDAPSVLGLSAWREIEARYGLALVRAGLQSLLDAGLIEPQPIEPLAHMLLGALAEGGLLIARADDTETARGEVGDSLDRLLRGLRK